MTEEGRPLLFTSFDEAWSWFSDGGELRSMAEWRQSFTAGRAQLLSFQVPIDDSAIADAIAEVQEQLRGIEGLAMFEREMLHISVRGVGFQVIAKKRRDDVTREDAGRIMQHAATLVGGAAPIGVDAGPVGVFPGSLILEVHDGGELATLRRRLGELTDDALGIDDAQYLPHITIAMFEDAAVADALRTRLPGWRNHGRVQATIERVELARWWFTGSDTQLPEREVLRSYALRG